MDRPASFAALVVLAGLFGPGCVIEQPPGPAGPPVTPALVNQIQQEALREAAPGGVVLAERRFASGVWDFRTELQRLISTGVPPSDDDMQRLLALFAWALERTPEGDAVGVGDTATNMREAASQMRSAGPAGSPPVRDAFGAGLREGISAVLALADGPYNDMPKVVERADELRAMYDPTGDATPPINYAGVLEVMRRAGFVLEAILEARGATASP